jgi:DNA-binding winged helix-turn-helix (wHTH) protein
MLAFELHHQAGRSASPATLSANGLPAPVIRFDRFHLDRTRRRLELDGARVRVGDRALDILIALATRPGEVVSHNELLDQVWPGMVADGATLRFHITALRKALGDPAFIRNVHGRGYCLTPPAEEASPRAACAPPASVSPDRAGESPREPDRMVRWAETVEEIARLLEDSAFVTLVGPGGIGKPTATAAAAHAEKSGFDDARFLDLGGLPDGAQATPALASMFGLPATGDDPTTTLVRYLSERLAPSERRLALVIVELPQTSPGAPMFPKRGDFLSPRQ